MEAPPNQAFHNICSFTYVYDNKRLELESTLHLFLIPLPVKSMEIQLRFFLTNYFPLAINAVSTADVNDQQLSMNILKNECSENGIIFKHTIHTQ